MDVYDFSLRFSLTDWHIVEVELFGPMKPNGNQFSVKTVRCNPADPGVVTGSATYNSFLSSIYRAKNKGSGVHLCWPFNPLTQSKMFLFVKINKWKQVYGEI